MDINLNKNSYRRTLQSPPSRRATEPVLSEPTDAFERAAPKRKGRGLLTTLAMGGMALTTLAGCQTETAVEIPATQEHLSIECQQTCLFDTGFEQAPEMAVIPEGSPVINLFSGEVKESTGKRGSDVVHLGKGFVLDDRGAISFAPDFVNPQVTSKPTIDLTAKPANYHSLRVKGDVVLSNDEHDLSDDEFSFSESSALADAYSTKVENGEVSTLYRFHSEHPVVLSTGEGQLDVSHGLLGKLANIKHDAQSGTYTIERKAGMEDGRIKQNEWERLERLTSPETITVSYSGDQINIDSPEGSHTFTSPRVAASESPTTSVSTTASESSQTQEVSLAKETVKEESLEKTGSTSSTLQSSGITQNIVVEDGGTFFNIIGDPVINISPGEMNLMQ